MLIVSQDKKTCVDLKNILYLRAESNGIYMFLPNSNYEIIAEYKNSKRAKEVLKTVWFACTHGEKSFIMPEE